MNLENIALKVPRHKIHKIDILFIADNDNHCISEVPSLIFNNYDL